MADEGTTIRYSERAHEILAQLKADGVIAEMRDGYRLGIALAAATGTLASTGERMRTFLNVGSFDPDGTIRNLIAELYPNEPGSPYEVAERLAEAGVLEIGRLYESGQLRFGELLAAAQLGSTSSSRPA